jgi:cbb3-type cytochrome oxidase subunit 3
MVTREGFGTGSPLPVASSPAERFPSALALILYTVLATFVAEVVVELALPQLEPPSGLAGAFLDAALLGVTVCPVLLLCLYRPAKRQAMARARMLEERDRLIEELREAMGAIRTLQGVVPICMYCKRIRAEDGSWQQVEVYVRDHSHADFSHGMCPECHRHVMEEMAS